jgi:hypothetical protein
MPVGSLAFWSACNGDTFEVSETAARQIEKASPSHHDLRQQVLPHVLRAAAPTGRRLLR